MRRLRIGRGFSAAGSSLLLAASAHAAPTLVGSITSDEVWSVAGSPYVVTGDVTIESGASLTLEPGVEVKFAKSDSSSAGIDPDKVELVVRGTLSANGTAPDPVLLHAQEGDFGNSWYGVVVDAAASSVTLKHVDIEAANNAITTAAPGQTLQVVSAVLQHNYTGIWLSAGAPLLDGLRLTDNAIAGVYAEAKTADLTLSLVNSVASLNGSYGVFVTASGGRSANVALQSSTFYGNTSSGVTCKANGADAHVTLGLTNSVVSANGILGIDASALDGGVASVTATYSDVYSNGEDFSGAAAGTGCISADPAFIDAPGDLRLAAGSACIDAGTADGAPAADFQGRARPQGAATDLGAYEYELGDVAVVETGDAGAAGAAAGGETDAAGGAISGGTPQSVEPEGGAGRGPSPDRGAPSKTPGGAAATPATSRANGGCNCELSGGAQSNAAVLGLAAVCLVGLGRRRRRRRPETQAKAL